MIKFWTTHHNICKEHNRTVQPDHPCPPSAPAAPESLRNRGESCNEKTDKATTPPHPTTTEINHALLQFMKTMHLGNSQKSIFTQKSGLKTSDHKTS